jgi:hypothetical protein
MTPQRTVVPVLVAALALLAACGGDDAGSSETDTPTETAAPSETAASSETVAPGDTMAPTDDTDPAITGFEVLDVFELTVDAPAHLAGSVRLEGLAADTLSAPRCMNAGGFLDVSYSVEDGSTTGLPFEMFSFTADGAEGPGTYTASFNLSAQVPPPNGGMPFTEVFGQEGEVTLTDDASGTFVTDDGYGNAVTGSWSCTTAPAA